MAPEDAPARGHEKVRGQSRHAVAVEDGGGRVEADGEVNAVRQEKAADVGRRRLGDPQVDPDHRRQARLALSQARVRVQDSYILSSCVTPCGEEVDERAVAASHRHHGSLPSVRKAGEAEGGGTGWRAQNRRHWH